MKKEIKLSDSFSYSLLFRFTFPSICMMIFASVYSVVDGFFVSNFAGKTPFAAINLVMPVLMILATVGLMFGTGGSALVAKTFGENKKELANRYFSLFVYVAFILGIIFAVLGIVFIRPVARLLGAEGEMLDAAVQYSCIYLCALPFNILQMMFQSFFVTAEKPKLGFIITVLAGCTNIVLDRSRNFVTAGIQACGCRCRNRTQSGCRRCVSAFLFRQKKQQHFEARKNLI